MFAFNMYGKNSFILVITDKNCLFDVHYTMAFVSNITIVVYLMSIPLWLWCLYNVKYFVAMVSYIYMSDIANVPSQVVIVSICIAF